MKTSTLTPHEQYLQDFTGFLQDLGDSREGAEQLFKLLRLPVVSKSVVCEDCYGYGYTVDKNGRRKDHCYKCD